MRKSWRLTTLGLALLCLAPAASAQEEDERDRPPPFLDDSRRIELSASLVIESNGINYNFLPEGKESVTSDGNSRLSGELRFSFFFNRYKTVGLEGSVCYTRATGQFQQPPDLTDPDNPIYQPLETVDHNVISYQGNIIYNFGYLDVVPFVALGGGVNRITPAEGSSYTLDGSYYNVAYALGVKYFLKEWFGVRAQMSHYYYFLQGDEVDGNAHALRFHVGGVFTF